MRKHNFFLLLAASIVLPSAEQGGKQLSLFETIAMARVRSVDAVVALSELKTSYWEYRTFQADLLPEVNLTGTLPDFKKSYSSYQLEDGSYKFVRNNSLGLSGELSVDQNIWFTGGRLSLTSSLDFLKQMGGGGYKQYMSVPIGLKFTQPIFGVNTLKWNRRIEPVRYAEAKAKFITATEEVTMKAITYFFNFLLDRENLTTARQNLDNTNRLYEVAIAKRQMGQISENELLQLKLNALRARAALTEKQSSLNASRFQLVSFLGLSEDEAIEPLIPVERPAANIEYSRVLELAHARNSFAQHIRRRQLEADYGVAKAKGDLRSISFFTNVGYSGEDSKMPEAYRNLRDHQVVQVGVTIPILDWGKRKGKVKVAESDRQVIQAKIRQEQMNFNQNIFLLVEKYNNQAEQLQLADESDKIARKRYKTSVETFLIGKISTLDLNDSQHSKDEARQKLISEMYYYWFYYYQIRSVTLWDFLNNTELEVDFEDVVKR